MAGFIENVQDLIARFLAKNRSATSPDSDVRAGLRETSVHENPSHQGRPLIGKRVSDSVWMRSKRKEGSLLYILSDKKYGVNAVVIFNRKS